MTLPAAAARGHAPLSISTLVGTARFAASHTGPVSISSIRCAGGVVFETPGGTWTLTYDAASDTFTIDPAQWGGALIVWERVRGTT